MANTINTASYLSTVYTLDNTLHKLSTIPAAFYLYWVQEHIHGASTKEI